MGHSVTNNDRMIEHVSKVWNETETRVMCIIWKRNGPKL